MAIELVEVLGEARDLGFLGPGPVDDHVDHARAFVVALPSSGLCVDLGSGGGVPGLVAADALPDTSWVLVESMARRAEFLRRAVEALDLGHRVVVHEGRAEAVPPAHREAAVAVTARGFGPPSVLAECAAGWLGVGGLLVVSEPPGGDPARWAIEPLTLLGFGAPTIDAGPPALALLQKMAGTPAAYPRRIGVPGKRPLWTGST